MGKKPTVKLGVPKGIKIPTGTMNAAIAKKKILGK